jgi:hypothetical protein
MFMNQYLASKRSLCTKKKKCKKPNMTLWSFIEVKQKKRKSVWEGKLGEGRRENVEGDQKHGPDSDHGEEGFHTNTNAHRGRSDADASHTHLRQMK